MPTLPTMDALAVIPDRVLRASTLIACCITCCIAAAACSSDATVPVSPSAAQLYWGLHFNWKAVNLALTAPYNTAQLTATLVNAEGNPITSDSVQQAVRYRTADSSLTVTGTGLVTAHYATSTTTVIAEATLNGTTFVDTTRVRVTDTPLAAPLATLSIQPKPGELDSARIAYDQYFYINNFNGNIPVYATIATGDAASDTVCSVNLGCPLLVYFTTSDSTIAWLTPFDGYLNVEEPGHVTFYASTLAYGVGRRDSLAFGITYPLAVGLSLYASSVNPLMPYILGNGITVGVGGRVVIGTQVKNRVIVSFPYTTDKIRRVFEGDALTHQLTDTLLALSPNVSPTMSVVFDSAGTYTFHYTILGPGGGTTDGTIYVSDGP